MAQAPLRIGTASDLVALPSSRPLWYSPQARNYQISWHFAARRLPMRQFINSTKRAVKRVNSRLTLGGFVLAAVGAAAWSGWSYTRPAPKGPTKQVATGVDV